MDALRYQKHGVLTLDNPAIPDDLETIQLGAEMSENQRKLLAEQATIVAVAANQSIFREDDRHPFIYWVLDGCVTLEMSTSSTGSKLLLTLGRGDLLAWSAFLHGGRMTASAKTNEATRLLAFDASALEELCRIQPEIGFHVMRRIADQLSKRLLATRLQLLDLFSHPGEAHR